MTSPALAGGLWIMSVSSSMYLKPAGIGKLLLCEPGTCAPQWAMRSENSEKKEGSIPLRLQLINLNSSLIIK